MDYLAIFARPNAEQLEAALVEGAYAFRSNAPNPFPPCEESWAWELGWRLAEHLERAKQMQFEELVRAQAELQGLRMRRARA